MESVLKKWLKSGKDPRDFYELIDCRRLEDRVDLLTTAIDRANEFFFQCQEHGDAETRKRAKHFQRLLAEARQIIGDPPRWEKYDGRILARIERDFDRTIEKYGTPSDEQIELWLTEQQAIAKRHVPELFAQLKERIPQEVDLVEIDDPFDKIDIFDDDAVVDVTEASSINQMPVSAPLSQTQPNPDPPAPVAPALSRSNSDPDPPVKQTAQFSSGLKREYTIVGIDLGTTYSAIAYVDKNGKAQVVCNPEDQQRPIMPSAILFEDGEAIVGQAAIENAFVEPDNVVQFAKRSLGERKTFNVDGQTLTPEAVSALILKQLVHFATSTVGPIHRAVITVPAFFNEKRRAATVQCGELAGLKVEATLNEPSAALIGYGLHHDPELEGSDSRGKPLVKNYVVYDLGGGTFDVTVMAVSRNRIKELATGGNRELGGMDWDQALVDYVADQFEAAHGSSPRDTNESLQALMAQCNAAKIQLSSRKRTVVMCSHAGLSHRVEITRDRFNELTAAMLAMTELTVETCLRDAKLEWDDITDVLMVGGSTMMPMVQNMLARIAGKPPRCNVDPSTVVAQGAAIYAGVLETQGAISGASEHQGSAEPEHKTTRPPNSGFVVEQLDDEEDDLEAIDLQLVNSHGVGVYATKRGKPVNVVMIPRNSELPTTSKQLFRTTRDGLRELRVRVSEGDSTERASSDLLGICVLGPLPAGLPQGTPVELHIGFSKQGRIQVSADCKGKNVRAEIEAQALLSEVQMLEEQKKVNRLATTR